MKQFEAVQLAWQEIADNAAERAKSTGEKTK